MVQLHGTTRLRRRCCSLWAAARGAAQIVNVLVTVRTVLSARISVISAVISSSSSSSSSSSRSSSSSTSSSSIHSPRSRVSELPSEQTVSMFYGNWIL